MKTSLRNRHRKFRPALAKLRPLLQRWEKLLPVRLAELSVVFLDDLEMADLHGRLMDEPTPTDVLTLDYGGGNAEIFISLDTAHRQAAAHRNTFSRELRLYLAHGLLHLAGYNDHTPAQIRRMRKAERMLLRNHRVQGPRSKVQRCFSDRKS
jgi:probable rRNA maturation factor